MREVVDGRAPVVLILGVVSGQDAGAGGGELHLTRVAVCVHVTGHCGYGEGRSQGPAGDTARCVHREVGAGHVVLTLDGSVPPRCVLYLTRHDEGLALHHVGQVGVNTTRRVLV